MWRALRVLLVFTKEEAMDFLLFEEYRDLSVVLVDEETFKKLYKISTRVLSYETNDYFDYNDFNDTSEWIKNKYKEAITLQIDHMYTTKQTSTHSANSQPSSVSLGRTTVSSRSGQSNKTERKFLISEDVLMVLSNTGLLYRGVY